MRARIDGIVTAVSKQVRNGQAVALVVFLAAALLGACKSADQEELERLRQEVASLQSKQADEAEAGDGPSIPLESIPHFAGDSAQGTLAGLAPGDTLATARARLGPETLSRSWQSEGILITQYVWELDPGLLLRLNTDRAGQVIKVAVALDRSRPTHIRVFGGIALGQDTFAAIQEKFGPVLTTDLHFWGARGLYTVAQRGPFATGQLLEFTYQMPDGLSRAVLNQVGNEVQRRRDAVPVESYLQDQIPYQVALAEAR